MVLRSNFALLLTIEFASLISSLINIISLLFITFDWTKVHLRGSLLGRMQGDREPVSLLLAILVGDAIWDCTVHFFFFFSATILSGPYLWDRYSQRLQIECAAWSCGLILHCCLLSNSLRHFFFFSATILSRFCPDHISGTVTRRDCKLSVLLGPAV